MTRLRSIGEFTAAAVMSIATFAAIAFVVVGGMFYRTACPSKAEWTFNPIPFITEVDADVATGQATACSTDTATGYYAGKVPLVGGPLRGIVKSFTGQP
jgi:hypothetical protein